MAGRDDALPWLREMFPAEEDWPEFGYVRIALMDRTKPPSERWAELDGMAPWSEGFVRRNFHEILANSIVESGGGADTFVCPYLHSISGRKKGRAKERKHAHADIDGPVDLDRVRELGAFAVLSGSMTDGKPHAHVYVRLGRSVDADEHEMLCRALGAYAGGEYHDRSKVSDEDVLRPPGTVNHKRGAAVTWGIRPDEDSVVTWDPEGLRLRLGVGSEAVGRVRERNARISDASTGSEPGDAFSRALEALGDRVEWVRGGRARAHCPSPRHANGNANAALSLQATGDTVWPHCFAGCTQDELRGLLGLSAADLWGDLFDEPEFELVIHDRNPDPAAAHDEDPPHPRIPGSPAWDLSMYTRENRPVSTRKPDLMPRTDGACLVLSGQVNMFYGLQGTLKTTAALGKPGVDELVAGGAVAYLDLDGMGLEAVLDILFDNGMPEEALQEHRFRYLPCFDERQLNEAVADSAERATLVIIDAMNKALLLSNPGVQDPAHRAAPIQHMWLTVVDAIRKQGPRKTIIWIDHQTGDRGDVTANDPPSGNNTKMQEIRGTIVHFEKHPATGPSADRAGMVTVSAHGKSTHWFMADADAKGIRPGSNSVVVAEMIVDPAKTGPERMMLEPAGTWRSGTKVKRPDPLKLVADDPGISIQDVAVRMGWSYVAGRATGQAIDWLEKQEAAGMVRREKCTMHNANPPCRMCAAKGVTPYYTREHLFRT